MLTVVLLSRSPSRTLETSRTLVKYLCSSQIPLKLHVAMGYNSDTTDLQTVLDRAFHAWKTSPTWTLIPWATAGEILNDALGYVGSRESFLYVDDDWLLTKHLHLERALRILESDAYDIVRLGPVHPDTPCVTRYTDPHGWHLELVSQQDNYAFGLRPFVSTRKLMQAIGPLPNLEFNELERHIADRVMHSGLRIASVNVGGPWRHALDYVPS